MDRNATAGVLAELSASQNRPVHLVEVRLDSGTIYLTNGYKNVAYGGNSYIARGDTLALEGINESAQLQNTEVTGTMTGCDQLGPLWVSLMLSYNWINRKLVIYKAFLNDNGDSITSPILMFQGLMDEPTINDDPTRGNCSVTVSANSQLSDFLKRPGRRTNHAEQQIWFPGDMFFEFTSEQNKTIQWGGMTVTAQAQRRWNAENPDPEPGHMTD